MLIKIVEENKLIQSNIGVYIQMKWKFINMEKIEEVNLSHTRIYGIKVTIYWIKKNNQKKLKNGLRFSKKEKLTIKIQWSLSIIKKIRY